MQQNNSETPKDNRKSDPRFYKFLSFMCALIVEIPLMSLLISSNWKDSKGDDFVEELAEYLKRMRTDTTVRLH